MYINFLCYNFTLQREASYQYYAAGEVANGNVSENVECADRVQRLQENDSVYNNKSKMVGANGKIHCE